MKSFILLYFCFFVVVGSTQTIAVFAQEKSKARAEVSAPIVRDKPAPYISFERAGKRHPLLNGESDEGIWLRLHNNTRWAIRLEMSGIPSAYGDANLFYEVLAGNNVVVDMRCHVCSSNQLPPGKSIVFSVPREYLDKDLVIRISFNYEWELDDRGFDSLERQHYVYFYASDLSKGMTVRPLFESHSRATMKKENVAALAPAAMPAGSAQAHSAPPATSIIRILKFEVDGKRVDKPFKVLLYVGKRVIELTMTENLFILPPDIRKYENVGVRVLCEEYDLFFDRVAISSFDVDWIVGVDHKPFKQEYVEPETAAKLRFLYYISFVPKDADGSRLMVRVFK